MDLVNIEDDYIYLCDRMLDTKFIYFVGNDCNRAEDGLSLRVEFEHDNGIINDIDDECTVLEMFVKLAIRCDEDVMYDAEYGNRVDKWFWEFLDGLGLTKFNNRNYVSEDVDRILDDFNNRHYGKKGGRGCAFEVRKPLRDMSTTEIWYQMMWWLNEKYPET
jgi:hypothetical protein